MQNITYIIDTAYSAPSAFLTSDTEAIAAFLQSHPNALVVAPINIDPEVRRFHEERLA